jgi:hypothetical protein
MNIHPTLPSYYWHYPKLGTHECQDDKMIKVRTPSAVNLDREKIKERMMDIIFDGRHDSAEAEESLLSMIRLFRERYHITQFREMHLSLTLVDDRGDDVELIDSETEEAFRVFEVRKQGHELTRVSGRPSLKLIINNTKNGNAGH